VFLFSLGELSITFKILVDQLVNSKYHFQDTGSNTRKFIGLQKLSSKQFLAMAKLEISTEIDYNLTNNVKVANFIYLFFFIFF
jgi:hypothetical protein